MLGDLLADVVSSIVGDAFVEQLFPGSKAQHDPRDETLAASLPAVAGFLAGIAAAISVAATLLLVAGAAPDAVVLWLSAAAMPIAVIAAILAGRATRVMSRRRRLARLALWLGRGSIVLGFVNAILSIIL